jgi:hypothetical protein
MHLALDWLDLILCQRGGQLCSDHLNRFEQVIDLHACLVFPLLEQARSHVIT